MLKDADGEGRGKANAKFTLFSFGVAPLLFSLIVLGHWA